LSSEEILIDPIVTVTVVEYQEPADFGIGRREEPITFQASGPVTLLEAINRAGGLSPEAVGDSR
jgi:protein involved in polysaccharide export with SLBB domain